MLKKIAFASAGFLLLASPLLVSAQTATDIQARIGALLAQLTQLQEQLASQTGQQPATPSVSPTLTPSSTSGGCAQIITRFLIVGSSGPDVKELQGFLITRGYLASDALSGYFGPLTQAALQSWQAANGIVSSGDPFSTGYGATGPRTRTVLALACTTPVSPSLPSRRPTCPVMPVVDCAPGYYPTSGGTDSNGCGRPTRCVATTPNAEITVNERCTGVTFTSNRRQGDLAADVLDIKKFLNMPVIIDRTEYNFDSSTESYVRAFQRKYGLEASAGVWDAMTRAKANAINAACQLSGLTVSAWLEDPTGRGKESFEYGDQLVIKWSASPVSDVELNGWGMYSESPMSIELRPYGNESAAGLRIVRVKPTTVFPYTYTWNVTREGLYGDTVAPGRYYVYVNVASKQQGGYRTGIAGPILIGATTTVLSSITVVSPNGGGYYSKGEPIQVQWTAQNTPSDNQMLIRLRSTGTNQEYNLTTTLNDGFERVDLSSVPAGAYTLEIKTAVNGQSYVDASDSYFKIVEATPQSCTFNGQTIASGSSVTAYQASSVAAGQTCTSQTRTCQNGSLSGSYTNTSCTVQSGSNVPTTVNAFWTSMYSCVLDRAADTAGLNYWVEQTNSVGSPPTAYRNFYDSAEYRARGTSDTDYVNSLYQCVLFRATDSGPNYWVGQLQGGASRDSVLQNFVNSAEFQGTQGPALRSATGLTIASANTQMLSQLASELNAIIAILNSLKEN